MENYEQYFIRLNYYKTNIANMKLSFDSDDILGFMDSYIELQSGLDASVTTVMVF